MTGAEAWHVPRLPVDERCGVRSDPKDSPGATTANHHEAGDQPLERGAARFSVPAWILRSRAPTGYSAVRIRSCGTASIPIADQVNPRILLLRLAHRSDKRKESTSPGQLVLLSQR